MAPYSPQEYQKGGGSQGTANSCFCYSIHRCYSTDGQASQAATRLGAFPCGLPCAQIAPSSSELWTWFCSSSLLS